ncbi:cytochrome b5-like [Andrographis paniculata]|uniref:cytochrome b5-like n=1 Tax=Andrographis paniculata TaxID=175694 RepID=UPI0021E79540|nr:cytochrome b5-like [Andrographis paniculata]
MVSKVYAFEEVRKHNQTKDCWLIIHGKVFNVTPFMEEHPGGPEVLLAATGKDGTSDFEDIGHSDEAKDLMDKYYIGEIDAETIPLKPSYIYHQEPDKTSSDTLIKILQFLVPLLILGIALAFQYGKK